MASAGSMSKLSGVLRDLHKRCEKYADGFFIRGSFRWSVTQFGILKSHGTYLIICHTFNKSNSNIS